MKITGVVNKMKKSLQILGQPIISILDGTEIGKVKSLVINPDKGAIDFLTIEHEDWQVSVKAIPFKKVIGIGAYAVTVDSDRAVIDLNEIPIANQLVNKKIKIIATKVMTRKGELLGEVKEYYVDDETGNLLGLVLQIHEQEVVMSSEFVLTYGKDIIIVQEEAASHFLNSAEQLIQLESEEASELHHEADQVENGELNLFKEKQVQLLKGKKVKEDILNHDGDVIIAAGTILTAEDVVRAQNAGAGVVVELSMNVEE